MTVVVRRIDLGLQWLIFYFTEPFTRMWVINNPMFLGALFTVREINVLYTASIVRWGTTIDHFGFCFIAASRPRLLFALKMLTDILTVFHCLQHSFKCPLILKFKCKICTAQLWHCYTIDMKLILQINKFNLYFCWLQCFVTFTVHLWEFSVFLENIKIMSYFFIRSPFLADR